ncbi:MAG: type II/IV secretion system protein [Planctomycetes bacterium]|nr:type II/IV secretion system protein [Planctomycetota bacterium]
MSAPVAAQRRIINRLKERQELKTAHLRKIKIESELTGQSIVDIFVNDDMISDSEVAQIYAEHYGIRFLDLNRRKPSTGWLLALPENESRLRRCIVFGEVSGGLVAAVADPGGAGIHDMLTSRFDRPIQLVVSPAYQIVETQNEVYGQARHKGTRTAQAIPSAQATTTVSSTGLNMSEQLDSMIDEAVDRRASDIHIESEEDRLRVRYRIDGRMIEARAYPTEAASALVSRIKVLANLDITEHRKPLDGRFAHKSFEQTIDIRTAIIPTVNGERVTMRLLAMDRSAVNLEQLGMELETRQAFERLIRRPHGIVLITGPTGSGKSTTLYAALAQINSIDRHIITIEDPVEYHMPGINQVQVDSEYGVTFAAALRSIVRHDPDVIMVGEIRDEETAHLALEASLTGHLVFATLHTNSAVGALTRLLDMNCEPYLVSSAIIGVMAQRLVRKICTHCRKEFDANQAERRMMDTPEEREDVKVYRGTGCARCGRSGYYDRLGIYEYVPFDPGLSSLVMDKTSTEEMYAYAVKHGAIMLRDDALAKVRRGLTTLEEAVRVTVTEVSH